MIVQVYEKIRDWATSHKKDRVETARELEDIEPEFDYAQTDIETLESKWLAVLEFRHLQDLDLSTNEAVDEIGERFNVGTGRNVRLLSQYVEDRGTLVRRVGSGAPRSVTNRPDIIEFFNEKAKSFEYVFTYEVMANAIIDKFGVGSTGTVKSLMDLLEYTKTRRVIRPFLTEE